MGPLQLSAASGVPFYRQIVDQVTQMAATSGLVAGEQVPSVRELAGTLQVSLITVRRAYEELERAGILVRKQGQGTFVAEGVQLQHASQAHARRLALEGLFEAIAHARMLGVPDDELRTFVLHLLEKPLAAPWRY